MIPKVLFIIPFVITSLCLHVKLQFVSAAFFILAAMGVKSIYYILKIEWLFMEYIVG